ncbi:LysR family transcriptional regulator [Rhizobium sullae]|uniref:LysR family transcriptional regulator n=1 Tax=Rhizobium sullae TaxID=50338 RepID=A0A2N0D0A1_RHISU|nr:LysR family transcriptional regulator [Rhizobium sullae]PKA39472.1 LysR family transcriptional regulator [Rhizobium sullae]
MKSDVLPLFNRLHLRHLRLLMAIEQFGSLNQAAAALGLTQPGASKSLVEIEDALGQALFVRTNKGLHPTEGGRCALRYVHSIYSQLYSLRHELDDITAGHGGRLRVGAIMGAVPFISEMVLRFVHKYPSISVEFVEDTSLELLRQLENGLLDIAVGRTSVSNSPEQYESAIVRDETLAVVANVNHPAAHRKRVELVDLSESRWIVYTANMPMRRLLEREFQQAGIHFPRHLLETRSAFTTLSLIQKDTSFVALLSSDVASFCTSFGLATILPLQLLSRSEPYEVMTLKNATLSSVARRFLEDLSLDRKQR